MPSHSLGATAGPRSSSAAASSPLGSGFQSKDQYLFGKIDMQIKLVPGNSAGTVTAYYLSSQGPTHDEIDFEFLGNLESRGIAFPKQQPLRIYSSLWNADDWATRGRLVKTDWSEEPFAASYRGFKADACVVAAASGASKCGGSTAVRNKSSGWRNQEVDSTVQERMRWVQKNYMIYNYCSDLKRFPQGLPPECSIAS